MKKYIIPAIIMGVFCFIGCATSQISLRAFIDRAYRPCADSDTTNPVGKFCYKRCVKYKALHAHESKNCKEWSWDIKDFNNPDTFKEFRAAGFILINEGSIK